MLSSKKKDEHVQEYTHTLWIMLNRRLTH